MIDDMTLRFWSHVSTNPESGCMIWKGATTRDGYGVFQIATRWSGLAHRMAWKLTYGPIPAGLLVCHHCDNPPCVNPAHLFVGTAQDNTNDMRAKGRGDKARGGVGRRD